MKIKVLVISDYRHTNSVRPEAEMFLGLHREGIAIEIMTYADSYYGKQFKKAGIRVIDYHPEKKISRSAIQKIKEELIRGKHQFLHLFNRYGITNGIFAAWNLPTKVILYRGYTGNINWYDPTAYLKFLNPRVDKVICLAKSIEEYLHRQFVFAKSKAITINKGHDLSWYSQYTPIERSEINIPEDAFLVTNVANVRRMKGIPYLIEAFNHFPEDRNIHLALVGNGMDSKLLKDLIEKNKNKDKIHILGYREDALRIVAASDTFALPSIKGEATTKALIEAMALGIAPVITSIPGNRRLVYDKEQGLVIPPFDPKALAKAILEMQSDPIQRLKYGQMAQEHIQKNFNIKDSIKKTKNLYESMSGIKLKPEIYSS